MEAACMRVCGQALVNDGSSVARKLLQTCLDSIRRHHCGRQRLYSALVV